MKKIARCILFTSLSVSTSACAQAMSAARYPVTPDFVARALHADGIGVQPEEIRMLTQASAAVSNPALELLGAERMPDGHLRMRIRCRKASECVPFSVAIGGNKVQPGAVAEALQAQSVVQPVIEARLTPPQPPSPVVAIPAIHAGAKLTLLMDDGHMRIHLPVVALDNSSVGNELRVCTPDHKRTFRATAMDATTVRGIAE